MRGCRESQRSRCSHRPASLNQNKCLLPKEEDFRKVAIERPAARVTRTPHSVTESSHQNNSTFPPAPRLYDSPRTHGAAPRTPPQPYGRAESKTIQLWIVSVEAVGGSQGHDALIVERVTLSSGGWGGEGVKPYYGRRTPLCLPVFVLCRGGSRTRTHART